MQINSTTNVQQQYFNTLESKHKENVSQSFKEELSNKDSSDTVQTTSQTEKVKESQERFHEVFTYANTKGMTDDDIDKYFSERTEEEREHIKLVVGISNVFSEDDVANEAVFNEFKRNTNLGNTLIPTGFFEEKGNFAKGKPELSNVLRVNSEWVAAKQAGIENPQAQGIFMNAADKARYESGDYSINQVTFTSNEAADFLSTMLNLAKQRMDEARGTAVFDDYKEAYERYQRMNDNYNSLLAEQEESTKVDINV